MKYIGIRGNGNNGEGEMKKEGEQIEDSERWRGACNIRVEICVIRKYTTYLVYLMGRGLSLIHI